MNADSRKLKLPDGLTSSENPWPLVFLDARGLNLWQQDDQDTLDRVNRAVCDALNKLHDNYIKGQALLKVHIGEPKCTTRMRPDFAAGSLDFCREKGATGVVAGDTTVAYTGPRGRKENPPDDCSAYLELARNHGWHQNAKLGAPFVVIDRPVTAIKNRFNFSEQQNRIVLDGINRFSDFYLAGGFEAADFVVNHAHFTFHGLAGLAGCMKSVAMGCASLSGKLRMHQTLLPSFDPELCVLCENCLKACPENALFIEENAQTPTVDPDKCIGCGECEAVCAAGKGAITLKGQEITDWTRGSSTLPERMADYTLGIMNGKWENVIHILHMYSVTERCDCLNIKQKPVLKKDLGFLIGKNPFAIDKLAGKIFTEAANKEGTGIDENLVKTATITADYLADNYGIVHEVPVEKIPLA